MWKRLEISLSPGSLLWSAACLCAKSLSRARLFATPWTVVHQAPLSMGFSRQDYWTGGWRRVLRVPWTARRSNQSILKEINPEYSLEGLMLKLKLQPFGHLMWRTDSLEKTLTLRKFEGRRRRGRQRMRWLDDIIDSMDMSLSRLQDWWWTGKPGVLQSMGLHRVGHDWVTELTNTGVGCHFLLWGIFPSRGPKAHLLHWRVNSLPPESPWKHCGVRIACRTAGCWYQKALLVINSASHLHLLLFRVLLLIQSHSDHLHVG